MEVKIMTSYLSCHNKTPSPPGVVHELLLERKGQSCAAGSSGGGADFWARKKA